MENEFDVLGFNPADLNVFKTPEVVNGPSNEYRPKPADSKSEDGVYRSIIKLIYNPFNQNDSIVETQSYNMNDKNGFFSVVSSLTDNDKNCPIFKAWAKYHFSKDPAEKMIAESESNGGPGYFDKRYTRWVTIQVMEDNNHPELVGKYLIWKLPKSIYDIVVNKMKPSPESKKVAIPVMDYLFGRPIELEITPGPDDPSNPLRKTREISYSTSTLGDEVMSCTEPDGSSFLNDDQQEVLDNYVKAISKVWKSKDPAERAEMMTKINADPNTAELRKIYRTVLEKIKTYCPNIREEKGYKPWSAEVTNRVNDYLTAISEGRNPREDASNAAAVAFNSDNTVTTTASTTAPSVEIPSAPSAQADDDDLPF